MPIQPRGVIRGHQFAKRAMVLLCIAAFGLVACGVPDDGPSSTEFSDKVGKICTDSNARVDAIAAMSAADPASIARGIERTVEEQRIAVSAIRAIAAPKGQRPKIDAWLESVDKVLKELEAIGSALDGGDAGNVTQRVTNARTLADQANAQAAALKLGTCASTAAPLPTTTTTSSSSVAVSTKTTGTGTTGK